jgi:hypothetical protein
VKIESFFRFLLTIHFACPDDRSNGVVDLKRENNSSNFNRQIISNFQNAEYDQQNISEENAISDCRETLKDGALNLYDVEMSCHTHCMYPEGAYKIVCAFLVHPR